MSPLIKYMGFLGLAFVILFFWGCSSTVFVNMGCDATLEAKAAFYGNVMVGTGPCGSYSSTSSTTSSYNSLVSPVE